MKGCIKRAAVSVLLVFSLIIFSGFSKDYNLQSYDVERILSTIRELSSREFNGRMAGTEYGKKTEEYVASKFKEIGLRPAGQDNTYFQKIQGVSGNPSGTYILEVLDGDKVVKTYKYGSDYKYFTSYSYSGEVTSRGISIKDKDESISQVFDDEIALINTLEMPGVNLDLEYFKKMYETGYRGLIVTRGASITRLKGQGGIMDNSTASKIPRVLVSRQVFDELKEFSQRGYNVHLKASFEVRNYNARNVIGLLKSGTNSNKYLIISAHMDHLGPDPDGAYFPGALDNASGTAAVIEIARALAKQHRKPDVNLVFIAFSGEEVSLDGSRHYVRNPIFPLEDTRVINLDMVGAKTKMPISFITSGAGRRGANEADIMDQFRSTAQELNYPHEVSSSGASDHSPFAMLGVPAVTLIDFEKVIYHVPEDTIENIGVDNLNRAMDLTMHVIGEEAYYRVDGKVSSIVYVSGGVLVAAVFAFMLIKKRERKM